MYRTNEVLHPSTKDLTEAQLLDRETRIAEYLTEGESELDCIEQEALRAHHSAQVEDLVDIGAEDDILAEVDNARWFRELDPDVADYITEYDL